MFLMRKSQTTESLTNVLLHSEALRRTRHAELCWRIQEEIISEKKDKYLDLAREMKRKYEI